MNEKTFSVWEVLATEKLDVEIMKEKENIGDNALSFWDVLATERSADDKMEIVVAKHESLTESFRDLMRISSSVTKEKKDEVQDFIDLVSVEMSDIKTLLLDTTKSLLTPHEVSELGSDENKAHRNIDPSILFFGLDWTTLLLRWQTCGKKLEFYRTALEDRRVDIVVLTVVMEIIELTREELSQHYQVK